MHSNFTILVLLSTIQAKFKVGAYVYMELVQLHEKDEQLFLPNLGGVKNVLTLIVVGELLAILLVLADTWDPDFMQQLSMKSLFVQWTVLGSAGAIVALRSVLKNSSVTVIACVSYMVILLVTFVTSEIAFQLLYAVKVKGNGHIVFLTKNIAIAAIVAIIALRYLYLQHQVRRRLLAESRARVQALQSRIRPHFLFNSMNTIAALVNSQPDVAEQTVEDLADLFRMSLSGSDKKHTLGQELEMAKRYLRIEQLRLGDRVELKWDIAEAPLGALIPPVILQPLLENAVYHGIEPRVSGGVIQFSARLRDGEVVILVSNSMPDETEKKNTRKGHQIAIKNIQERLELSYNPPGKLKMMEDGGYFTVEVRIPYQRINR